MADFSANLVTNTAYSSAEVEGGTAEANLITSNTAYSSAEVEGGTISAVTVASVSILQGSADLGSAPSSLISPIPSTLYAVAGGGSVSSMLFYFGNSPQVINRVFDSVANKFVFWISISADTTGARYPGPGVFGVTTSDYVLFIT